MKWCQVSGKVGCFWDGMFIQQLLTGVSWILRVLVWGMLIQLAQEEACNLMKVAAACFYISRLIGRFSVYS